MLIAPETERGEKTKEQRQRQKHGKAARYAADAVLLHELVLFLIELLGIIRVFLFELVDLGLERRLLLLSLAALDIGIDLNKPQNEGYDQYGKKIAVAENAVKPANGIE